MSTKTSIKRIAAVAAVALTLGGFSAVSANAAWDPITSLTAGTIVPAQDSHAVGTAVTIPILASSDKASTDTGGTNTFTATFAKLPVNSALVSATSIVSNTATQATALATAGAALTQFTASANTLIEVQGATAARFGTSAAILAGNLTFTPDVPGVYQISIAKSVSTRADVTGVTAITIIVGGANVLQGVSGVGTKTASAVTGGTATVFYQLPGASVAGQVYSVTTTGGTVLNPLGCDNVNAAMVTVGTTAVRCSGTAVGTFASIDGSANYAGGIRYTNTTLSAGNALVGSAASSAFTFDASSATVGTQTITISKITTATGAPAPVATITVLWGTTAATAVSSLSTAFINAGATAGTANGAAATLNAPATAVVAGGVPSANIAVALKDANGVALNAQKLTVTIAGPGLFQVQEGLAGGQTLGTPVRAFASAA